VGPGRERDERTVKTGLASLVVFAAMLFLAGSNMHAEDVSLCLSAIRCCQRMRVVADLMSRLTMEEN